MMEKGRGVFFEEVARDEGGKARAGILRTEHAEIQTPVFMPVGTYGTVKAMSPKDLEEIDAKIILANAYHLFLRPGKKIVKELGGLHRFMSWNRAILTDSGGFQIYSLDDLRKISEEGVSFKSPIDGTGFFLTPEDVIALEEDLGADIIMGFDVCLPFSSQRSEFASSMELTLRWMERCLRAKREGGYSKLFGITQGGTFKDLRLESTARTLEMGFDGIALGGLSVGENKELTAEMVAISTDTIPKDKPVYLMGVGTPEDLVEYVSLGVDMFDCVMPTRNARNGVLFTSCGKLPIKGARFKDDDEPVDKECGCYVCKNFTRGYLRHLFNCQEILSSMLNTYHNLYYFINLMKTIRKSIINGRFKEFKREFYSKLEVCDEF